MSFLHRSWRPRLSRSRGFSWRAFIRVPVRAGMFDKFSGQRFDVVFAVLVLLLPGQRTPEFPRSNFQMTVKKFLWSKNFLWFPSEINFCWMNIPRKEFFFFESWRSSVHGWGWRIAVALKSQYLYAAVGLSLQLARSIDHTPSFQYQKSVRVVNHSARRPTLQFSKTSALSCSEPRPVTLRQVNEDGIL